ncbi:MAG: PqqD family protein [Abditibacteriota bacterium]|nr:PqqD family protein [Abditibacteriota bacterium]
MKIKDGYVLKTVAGEDLIINSGPDAADFRRMIRLNKTAAFMWRRLAEGKTPEETARAVAEEYSIDPDKARRDVEGFAEKLIKGGLAEA